MAFDAGEGAGEGGAAGTAVFVGADVALKGSSSAKDSSSKERSCTNQMVQRELRRGSGMIAKGFTLSIHRPVTSAISVNKSQSLTLMYSGVPSQNENKSIQKSFCLNAIFLLSIRTADYANQAATIRDRGSAATSFSLVGRGVK